MYVHVHVCTQQGLDCFESFTCTAVASNLEIRNWYTLQHTATHCNTRPHTATHGHTLQLSATHCNTLQHTATHCNARPHTATQCNALQHTAAHCCSLQSRDLRFVIGTQWVLSHTCKWVMSHISTHMNERFLFAHIFMNVIFAYIWMSHIRIYGNE